ncbi:MAG: YitT family protein [Solobacterium sp.]|nr:YitT family protein [Solobacterium sp.]MCH4049720.1 YitT family protein [Solobacterium sp.]MCH4073405.1 YitT family protein [Solobacterium sp.]MCI1313064.1 YitT family protein [Solobacterium sp.]MCI1406887.1 YitT family protein [Solobacterium sp.]
MEPTGLITGGTTGIALVVHHFTGMPVWLFVLFFNACMLVLGWIVLGWKFAVTTIVSTFTYPIFLGILDTLCKGIVLSDSLVLNAVYSGLGIGIALGLVIRTGSSTGGMDIPPLILHKLFGFPVSVTMNLFDTLILFFQAILKPAETVLWGILIVLIYTVVLDRMLMMGSSRTEVKVMSEHTEEIRTAILDDIDRGLTLIESRGGYSLHSGEIILTILNNRELPRLEKRIHEIDPEAFLVISRVTEVKGKGFTLSR